MGFGVGWDFGASVGPFVIRADPNTFNPSMLNGASFQINAAWGVSGTFETPLNDNAGNYQNVSLEMNFPFSPSGSIVIGHTWIYDIGVDNTTITDLVNGGRGLF